MTVSPSRAPGISLEFRPESRSVGSMIRAEHDRRIRAAALTPNNQSGNMQSTNQ